MKIAIKKLLKHYSTYSNEDLIREFNELTMIMIMIEPVIERMYELDYDLRDIKDREEVEKHYENCLIAIENILRERDYNLKELGL